MNTTTAAASAGRAPIEHVELGPQERWEYYRRYYAAAAAFHGVHDKVVDDADVERLVAGLKTAPPPRTRRRIPLSEWRFALDADDEGLRREYGRRDHDESGWEAVRLPHSVNHVPPDPVRYGSTEYGMLCSKGKRWDIWRAEYALWYKARLRPPRLGPDEVAYLSFESVNLLTDVWVNDDPVMLGHLGLFPFRMEVSEEVEARRDDEVLVSLRVRNHATNTPYLFSNGLQIAYGHPPFTSATVPLDTVDASWAGIAGDACLEIVNRNHLEDAFIVTEKIGADSARLRCRVELRNETWTRFTGTVRVSVGRWTPGRKSRSRSRGRPPSCGPWATAASTSASPSSGPRPGTSTPPSLYLARVSLLDAAGVEIDDLVRTFGVRTIALEGTRFVLNGRTIVPRGTHDLSTYFGESLICPSDRAIVTDILLHKGMNATCSRWPSDMRMHYPRIAEAADQLGFMLSWTGYFEMWNINPEAEVYARRDVRAMVRSLRNHPSIIAWEMGDEPLMLVHHARRWRWYELVTDLVEQEDRSRPIIPAGAWCNELEELVARHPRQDLPVEERLREVLADYPLFSREGVVWDYHYCPYHPGTPDLPTHAVIDSVKRAFARGKPAIMTEFGIDGMPRFENVRHIYGEFRWKGSALMPVDRSRSDLRYYGRTVGQEDWRETQAAQALTLAAIIGRLRENPEDFAGYYLVTLVDPWTFTWGVVDAAFNAKLAWFVVRGLYGPVFVSAVHGSAAIEAGDGPLAVTASAYGDGVRGASLSIAMKDPSGAVVRTLAVSGLDLPADGRNVTAGEISVADLAAGTYAIEFEVRSRDGATIARLMELFILRQSREPANTGSGRSRVISSSR